MIISTWQDTSTQKVEVCLTAEEHWKSIGQFHLRLGTNSVFLTLQEVISLKRALSDAEREYFDDYIYGKETA